MEQNVKKTVNITKVITKNKEKNLNNPKQLHDGTSRYSTTKEKKIYNCENINCSKLYRSYKAFLKHMSSHLNVKYLCEICAYSTNRHSNWLMHCGVHSGVKNNLCDKCGALFNSRTELSQHSKIHDSTPRSFVCGKCRTKFLDAKILWHHKALHSKKKRYMCPECGKKFAQSSGLSQHKRIHRKNVKEARV